MTASETKTVPAETATASPMTIAPAHVDLSATFGDAPIRVDPGRNASATVAIQNLGNVPASGPLDLGVYASSDTQYDVLDQLLARFPAHAINLRPGRSASCGCASPPRPTSPPGATTCWPSPRPRRRRPIADGSDDVAVATTTA